MKTCHSLASQGKKEVVKQGKKFTVINLPTKEQKRTHF